ncbi:carbamoyltransferase [Saccharothrix syringae]|uniref:Carbamoyltransferase n=1 Tax=Saccharothrix syringae TaxID=103733 RepID=A0A5Q0HFD1_SACSY|nr:carbamoyltransferase [Saccharothrix syringae]
MGLNCCFSPPTEDIVPGLPQWFFHDASAVLVHDGHVVAAVEQERLNRIKHTNRFAGDAARACLAQAGIKLGDVDSVAFFFDEAWTDKELFHQYTEHPGVGIRWARDLITARFAEALEEDLPEERLTFVAHHDSHAYSAYPQSGYDDALVVVMDGRGEEESSSVYTANGDKVELLATNTPENSIGHWYTAGTELIGYGLFDEYKVMGLAPYGDPDTYAAALAPLYDLLPDGDFRLDFTKLRTTMFRTGFTPRRKGEPFEQQHKDFAAALQQVTERVATHLISHWQRVTGHRRLAIAGGVGQNCTLNGKLLAGGTFDDVFVHPAAHDAGAALGAALKVQADTSGRLTRRRVRDVYWGKPLPAPDRTAETLARWRGFVEVERLTRTEQRVAELLADGKVVAWVQGRSEFGPRALGNRSILADPRPEENRQRVNLLVKKRETYRPFAPSVQAENVREYFDIPEGATVSDFMVFTVPVREHHRAGLGAVTHVDGTARVHAVDRAVNERFWLLLEEFEARTGVPVLLNTSFNNHAEPIVDSVEDAVRTFLTTGLDHLVVDDFLVSKPTTGRPLTDLVPVLEPYARIERRVDAAKNESAWVTGNYTKAKRIPVGARTALLLERFDGVRTLGELGLDAADPADADVLDEVEALWGDRFLDLRPR